METASWHFRDATYPIAPHSRNSEGRFLIQGQVRVLLKIEGVAGGRINIGINCVLELNFTESDGWIYSNAIVGEIRTLTETDTPAGWLICDGTEYDILQYPRLAPIMLKLPFNAGVTDGRFRVPDLRGRFLQGADGDIGQEIEAGLPNIEGSIKTGHSLGLYSNSISPGALYRSGDRGGSVMGESGSYWKGFTLDASLSSPVYGKSDTVQPPALTVNYIIKY